MPTWLAIVIGVALAVVVVLAVGGALARRRQLERTEGRFEANLAQVNQDLAAAHAEDRGWARAALDAAARDALTAQRPDAATGELTLVQIIDRPGTDDDKAVYRVGAAGAHEERLTLGRRGGDWVFERLN
jgi:hypothetical protein